MKAIRNLLIGAALSVFASAAHATCTLVPFKVEHSTNSQFSSQVVAPSQCVNVAVLAAGNSFTQTFTVPTGANFVLFSSTSGCDFWASPSGSAAVPNSSVTDGSGSIPDPAGWWVAPYTQITLISAAACNVGASFYK